MMSFCRAAAVVLILTATAAGQFCAGGGVLLKNDNLPDVPGGALPVSVIQGLCEGESCAAVFDLSGIGQVVQLNSASVGFFAGGGAPGVQAVVNLRIFDGVTFSGTTPIMGNLIFDWAVSTGSNIQVTSHAINELDLTVISPPITVTTGQVVVAWDMLINTAQGSCASGYLGNFGTDNSAPPGSPCSTPPQKNLVFTLSPLGWQDCAFATVPLFPGGPMVPICGVAYNGNWVLRICAEDVTPTNPYTVSFLPSAMYTPGSGPVLVQYDSTSANAGAFYVPLFSATLGSTPIGGGIDLPIICDALCNQYFTDPATQSFFNLVAPGVYVGSVAPTGLNTGIVNLPFFALPFPVPLHFTHVIVSTGGTIVGTSDAATLTLTP